MNVHHKSVQAILLGIGLWVAGTALIGAIGRAPLFAMLAVPVTLVVTPVIMLGLTSLHLRGVSQEERAEVGFRLGALITLVQFPLDALGLFAVFNFGFLGLSEVSQRAVVLALEVGYFWMLVTPWWFSSRQVRRTSAR